MLLHSDPERLRYIGGAINQILNNPDKTEIVLITKTGQLNEIGNNTGSDTICIPFVRYNGRLVSLYLEDDAPDSPLKKLVLFLKN